MRFRERYPHFSAWLTFPTAPWIPPEDTDDNVGTVPTDLLLMTIGRQAERALGARLS